MKADVSLSGKQLIITLHDPENPSAVSGTMKGKLEGTKITNAFMTSTVGNRRAAGAVSAVWRHL